MEKSYFPSNILGVCKTAREAKLQARLRFSLQSRHQQLCHGFAAIKFIIIIVSAVRQLGGMTAIR